MTRDTQIYRDRFDASDRPAREAIWRVLCEDWFARFVSSGATVVDLGAGSCEFINAIGGARRVAIDHNPDVTEFAADGVECVVDEFVPALASLMPDSVDTILASNVFEHLPDREALFTCLDGARRVLTPSGRLLVMQPNIRAVKESFYDFADHSLPLTELGMSEALRACGFAIEECRARFLPYTTKGRLPSSPGLLRWYLRMPPLHRIFGGQMFIVARKA